MIEYKIQTVTATTRKPTAGAFYLDSDGNLFMNTGAVVCPWLEIRNKGAYKREAAYPVGPLTELTPMEAAEKISEKIQYY